MLLTLRNRINHLLLNRLLGFRYRWRRSRRLTQAVMLTEKMCIKAGLIYKARSRPAAGADGPAGIPGRTGHMRAQRHV